MRRHPLYRTAKDGLDNQAALDLVDDLMNTDTTVRIRQLLSGAHPRVVPVHAEEATGRNKIPFAYATVLAESLRLSVEPRIIQAWVANHGSAPSIYHRFASQPVFDSPVDVGEDYLIVDDTCTAGGTLANLKGSSR
jgi:adenine/guanine phosphoribosyltransferase-like PRPP-binding protein